MGDTIAYFFAILSTLALIVLWFANVHKVLYQKRDAVLKAQEELMLHEKGYMEKRGSPEESTAKHMLDTSTEIYKQILDAYNKAYHNPAYRIPGILMGFKNIKKGRRFI